MRSLRFLLLGMLTLVVLALLVMVPAPVADAATFTVDSTGDGGDSNTADGICDDGTGNCTLRAAIEQANVSAGTDTIAFNIPGAGPHTIQPASTLPTITDPAVIDGTTEPDFSGTPVIKLDVTNAWSLDITAGNSTVRGLVIVGYFGVLQPMIGLWGNGGNVIEGNYLGIDASGHIENVMIVGVALASPDNRIGGTTEAARNVISGTARGIETYGNATGSVIEGNFIGTGLTGTTHTQHPYTNYEGMKINDNNITIGGTTPGSRNIISGNMKGISIQGGEGNVVQGNFIGPDVTGSSNTGNGTGIKLWPGTNNTIGGTNSGAGNTIAFNGGSGVYVSSSGITGNTIRGNSIHSNGGKGINAPEGLAVPTITSTGSASGTACADCTVDVYSDDADEGRIYEGWTVADSGGDWSFPGDVTGPNVTATATDSGGTTSEFSAPCAAPDADCDGFIDGREVYMGTDTNERCANSPAADDENSPDAWPLDFNDDQTAKMQDVIFAFVTMLAPGGLNQDADGGLERVDLNGDGWISMQDIILGYVTNLSPTGLNTVCTP